ncbi:MAG: CoA-binding protein [Candidatus Absconditicoccaceae bacterium]
MIDKKFIYAVVGASNDKNKYGYKVFEDLLSAGYMVIPINPNEEKILGKKCYKKLENYKKGVDVIIFVTQPSITENIVMKLGNYKFKKIWMQPGSDSKNVISFCEKNNIDFVINSCIMIQRKNKTV